MRRATLKQEVREILNGKEIIKKPKPKRESILSTIPDVKPLSYKKGALIFIGLLLIGLLINATIATYVFFGSIILAGLIAISETNKYVRYTILKSNKFLDLIIFILTILATIHLGITLTASLTFAGLGYTLIYAPYLRSKN